MPVITANGTMHAYAGFMHYGIMHVHNAPTTSPPFPPDDLDMQGNQEANGLPPVDAGPSWVQQTQTG